MQTGINVEVSLHDLNIHGAQSRRGCVLRREGTESDRPLYHLNLVRDTYYIGRVKGNRMQKNYMGSQTN